METTAEYPVDSCVKNSFSKVLIISLICGLIHFIYVNAVVKSEQKWKKRKSPPCRTGSMAFEIIQKYICLGPEIMHFLLLSGVTAAKLSTRG